MTAISKASCCRREPRGLFKRIAVVFTTGETIDVPLGDKLPDGTIIGGRGPYGPFAARSRSMTGSARSIIDRYDTPPTYPAYQMAQSLLGLKTAYEKAAKSGQAAPDQEAVIAAFEHLKFQGIGTTIDMALGKGHQGITEIAYGTLQIRHQGRCADADQHHPLPRRLREPARRRQER